MIARHLMVRTGIVLLFTWSMAPSVSRAQDSVVATAPATVTHRPPHRNKVTIGPVIGLNFATWSGADVGDGFSRRTGLHGGLMITAAVSRVVSVQVGAMYSQEGTGVEPTPGGVRGSFKVDYVRVPLLLKAGSPLPGSKVRPYALLGPTLGIKVRCRIEATDGTQSASIDCEDPAIGLNLTTADLGLVLGFGVDVGRVTAGVRYQPGLRSIDDTSNDAAEVHNNLLAITAGYAF